MIGKTRTNVYASVEIQYEYLHSLIADIPTYYEKEYNKVFQNIENEAKIESDGDLDIYYSIFSNNYGAIDYLGELCVKSKNLVFLAIYSYFEISLNEIVNFYRIEISNNIYCQKVLPRILDYCELEINDTIESVSQIDFTIDFCRLLRNKIVHGELSQKKDEEKLKKYILIFSKYFDSFQNIATIEFLEKSLEIIKNLLIKLEVACDKKRKK